MTTKKLYKIKTKSILYEVFEVEAESYDKALDLMLPTVYDGQDCSAYPVDVERVGWWFDGYGKSVLDEDDEHKGLFGIPITEKEVEETPDYQIVKPEGCFPGDFREPTEDEWVADQRQAIADERLSETPEYGVVEKQLIEWKPEIKSKVDSLTRLKTGF